MLKKDEEGSERHVVIKEGRNQIDIEENEPHHGNDSGHTRHLIEQAAGAYALGRQLLGHKHHSLIKLVAEAMGAAGLYQEAQRDLA
jgi:hypothetical protein